MFSFLFENSSSDDDCNNDNDTDSSNDNDSNNDNDDNNNNIKGCVFSISSFSFFSSLEVQFFFL